MTTTVAFKLLLLRLADRKREGHAEGGAARGVVAGRDHAVVICKPAGGQSGKIGHPGPPQNRWKEGCRYVDRISGVPLLGVTQLPLNNPVNWMLKRALDVVGALVGIVLSAPAIALFGLLVYLESPGPIFYKQLRVGRRGRHFQIIKIRSMKLDAEKESGPRWATRSDARTLKIGAFMRRWNIDEFPQFWNVLKGDLSLVGPRPERPELIKKFREQILYYNARHNIVPGMTGWAQVNGFRGDTDLSERIRCDIYYIENWNPIFDLQIMFMTFFRWEGAH